MKLFGTMDVVFGYLHDLGQLYRIEYLRWDKNLKKLIVDRGFLNKFSVIIYLFVGK